jgi:hypothetical protein
MTLNSLDTVTLDAFVEALRQLDSLPKELQQQINQIGRAFDENPTAAVNQLHELAEHDCLKSVYQQARVEIQKQYQPQEKSRYFSAEKQNQKGVKPADETSNFAIKVKVMKADDSVAAAKNLQPEPPQDAPETEATN